MENYDNKRETTNLYSDAPILNVEEYNKKNEPQGSGNYNISVLLAYFVGPLGIHRMLNGKIPSGVFMMLLTFFSPVIYIIVLVSFAANAAHIDADEYSVSSVFWALFGVILWIGVMVFPVILAFMDLVTLMAGKFRNGKTGKLVKSDRSFFSTWSNIVVVVLLVISLITTITLSIIFSISEYSLNTEDNSENYVEIFNECMNNEESEIDDLEAFSDAIDKHFTEHGYSREADYFGDYSDTSFEYKKQHGDYVIIVDAYIDESFASRTLSWCSLTVETENIVVELNEDIAFDKITVNSSYINNNTYIDIYETENYSYGLYGSYDSFSDTFELEYYDYDEGDLDGVEYDVLSDELDIIEPLTEMNELYFETLEWFE